MAASLKQPRPRAISIAAAAGAVLLLAGAGLWAFRGEGARGDTRAATAMVTRGPLEVTITEAGSIESLNSVQVKSEVQGQTKILSIVEEGYQVTADDVAEGMVLVELDATELIDRQTDLELEYQNARAAYTEAREQYEIQRNQNASDVRQAELDVKFARLDFEKYMSADVAGEILVRVEPLDIAGRPAAGAPAASSEQEPEAVPEADVLQLESSAGEEVVAAPSVEIDFTAYADPSRLGDGEAGQRLRTLQDDLVLAEKEVSLAQSTLEGTRRLFAKEFVTKNDLENDEMALKRNEIKLESARTSKDLFINYEFLKQAEKLLSDYLEAQRKLERARKLAMARLAQAEAKLRSAEARFTLQTKKREEIKEQIENCVIRAEVPGLVVYGTGESNRWRDEDNIEEGATVRERQVILTIPQTAAMGVNVKVHEAYVQRVNRGQFVRVRVDAARTETLDGIVESIAVLPDSQNRWLNPDLKVYTTMVGIQGTYDWLKPGMSAEVEILVNTLEDVVQAPLQAVFNEGGDQVVYVQTPLGPERRVIETGAFNDVHVEVNEGLEPREVVLLRAPEGGAAGKPSGEAAGKPSGEAAEA